MMLDFKNKPLKIVWLNLHFFGGGQPYALLSASSFIHGKKTSTRRSGLLAPALCLRVIQSRLWPFLVFVRLLFLFREAAVEQVRRKSLLPHRSVGDMLQGMFHILCKCPDL